MTVAISVLQVYIVTLTALMFIGCIWALVFIRDMEASARAALVTITGAFGTGWGAILTVAFVNR